ncbi:hypothetical protein SSS_05250 [Sarcoptes scabiei]|uniref:Uncharacterized protein n=1 Tax=Sarcoptes scabiei TaxID=52283 RepID=A0A834VF40_SARSC|nr:hypothetical protein SSS_05250 [Sarcoptes scabiei]
MELNTSTDTSASSEPMAVKNNEFNLSTTFPALNYIEIENTSENSLLDSYKNSNTKDEIDLSEKFFNSKIEFNDGHPSTSAMSVSSISSYDETRSYSIVKNPSNHRKVNENSNDVRSKLYPKLLSSSSSSSLPQLLNSSAKPFNNLSTLAFVTNSYSAILLPRFESFPNKSNDPIRIKSNDSISSIGPIISVSNDDDDYEWSSLDFQSMINISIGGIIITIFFLVIFLLWLCFSKNDQDQYSIRKVSSENVNISSNNFNPMIKPNQRCKSECSLYINNPNSEDTQLNYPSVDGILHDREKIDENFSSITVIKKADFDSRNLSFRDIDTLNTSKNSPRYVENLKQFASKSIYDANQSFSDQPKGLQKAENLLAYCERNQEQINKFKAEIHSNEHAVDLTKQNLGNSHNFNQTSNQFVCYFDMRSKTKDNDSHQSEDSLSNNQMNFTKKRRNRMHNDSAAAIALNKSGFLPIQILNSNSNDNLKLFKDDSENGKDLCGHSSRLKFFINQSERLLDYEIFDDDDARSVSKETIIDQQPIVVYNERTAL